MGPGGGPLLVLFWILSPLIKKKNFVKILVLTKLASSEGSEEPALKRIEELIVRDSQPSELLYCILEQDTLSVA